MTPLLKIAYLLRPVLSDGLRLKLPLLSAKTPYLRPTRPTHPTPPAPGSHARRMLLLDGCVQPGMAPNINAATVRVFDTLGVHVLSAPKAACCGALRYHLNQQEAALNDMRRNIDAWWPYLEPEQSSVPPVEAILMTASGCGVTVKEYGSLLAHDPAYAEKAARVAALTWDVSEVLSLFADQLQRKIEEKVLQNGGKHTPQTDHPADPPLPVLAYHPPCTLQHGQQLHGQVEGLLRKLGFEVRLPQDSHICCGSAGTYSILQPELSQTLRAKKLAGLQASLQANLQASLQAGSQAGSQAKQPACIVSGNIGCLAHLQSGTELPVRHWIELVDQMLR
jgi:glycolate oxidase iron-sulfur subunit